jgi:hypothetical protein
MKFYRIIRPVLVCKEGFEPLATRSPPQASENAARSGGARAMRVIQRLMGRALELTSSHLIELRSNQAFASSSPDDRNGDLHDL